MITPVQIVTIKRHTITRGQYYRIYGYRSNRYDYLKRNNRGRLSNRYDYLKQNNRGRLQFHKISKAIDKSGQSVKFMVYVDGIGYFHRIITNGIDYWQYAVFTNIPNLIHINKAREVEAYITSMVKPMISRYLTNGK